MKGNKSSWLGLKLIKGAKVVAACFVTLGIIILLSLPAPATAPPPSPPPPPM